MHFSDTNPTSGPYVHQVASKFVALYYRVLNNYPTYLFQFYGSDSTVVVCQVKEDGPPETMKADNPTTVQELLRFFYGDASITIRNCTPQPSSAGCISLLITGLMAHKVLCPALRRFSDGYYIKTDTVLVFPRGKGASGSCSLLSPSSRITEVGTESAETTFVHAPTNGKPIDSTGMFGAQHTRVPSIEVRNGKPVIETSHTHAERANAQMGSTVNQKGIKQTFAFDPPVRGWGAMTNHQISGSNGTSARNTQGVRPVSARNRVPAASGGCIPCMTDFTGRCSSPLSAPGALASPMTTDGVPATDFERITHQQPWSLRSSPRIDVSGVTQQDQNEEHRLFVCKLPLGTTVETVTELFMAYGTLAEDEPVRVFTGQNNCYACVCYASDQDVQNAIGAEIRIGEQLVVTDAWRPRDRRPRRRRQDNAPEQTAIGATN